MPLVLTVGLLGAACAAPGPTPAPASPAPAAAPAPLAPTGPVRPAAEPGDAPPPVAAPTGTVIALRPDGLPWGVAVLPSSGTVVAALRNPEALAAYDLRTGAVRTVPAPGGARMLDLAAPDGPLLFPAENRDRVFRIDPATLAADAGVPAGRSPHQAVIVDDTTFVSDEFGHEVRALRAGRTVAEFRGPVQPGGITAVDGRVVAVDVATATLFVYDAATLRPVAALPAGDGPSHVRPLPGGRVAVSDVAGNAVYTYQITGTPRMLGRSAVPGRAFWVETDPRTSTVYAALSNTNLIAALHVNPDGSLSPPVTVPAVRQPVSMDIDPNNGTLYIAGYANSQLEIIRPDAFTSRR